MAYAPVDPPPTWPPPGTSTTSTPASAPTCWDGAPAALAATLPIVVTEIGQNDCTGAFVSPLMQWLDDHGIGYLAWSWNAWRRLHAPRRTPSQDAGRPWPLMHELPGGTPNGGYAQTFHDHLAALSAVVDAGALTPVVPALPATPPALDGARRDAETPAEADRSASLDRSLPTRRAFLGAAAALLPAACVATPAGSGGAERADVPAARAAGMPAPDVEALLAQMTLDEKIGQMTQVDKNALKDGDARSTTSSSARC